jgi:hypothetical protein
MFRFPTDPMQFHEADEEKVICEALSSKGDQDYKVDNLYAPLTYEDNLRLAIWNMKHNLKSGSHEFEFSNSNWRRPLINTLFSIFKQSCPTDFVPHGFLNVLKEMIMIYYNSQKEESKAPPPERWATVLKSLDRCANSTVPLKVDGPSLLVSFFHFLTSFFYD